MRQWCKTCKTPIHAEVAEPAAKAGVRPTRKPVQTPRHHKGPENDPQESPEGQFGTKNVRKMDQGPPKGTLKVHAPFNLRGSRPAEKGA